MLMSLWKAQALPMLPIPRKTSDPRAPASERKRHAGRHQDPVGPPSSLQRQPLHAPIRTSCLSLTLTFRWLPELHVPHAARKGPGFEPSSAMSWLCCQPRQPQHAPLESGDTTYHRPLGGCGKPSLAITGAWRAKLSLSYRSRMGPLEKTLEAPEDAKEVSHWEASALLVVRRAGMGERGGTKMLTFRGTGQPQVPTSSHRLLRSPSLRNLPPSRPPL